MKLLRSLSTHQCSWVRRDPPLVTSYCLGGLSHLYLPTLSSFWRNIRNKGSSPRTEVGECRDWTNMIFYHLRKAKTKGWNSVAEKRPLQISRCEAGGYGLIFVTEAVTLFLVTCGATRKPSRHAQGSVSWDKETGLQCGWVAEIFQSETSPIHPEKLQCYAAFAWNRAKQMSTELSSLRDRKTVSDNAFVKIF